MARQLKPDACQGCGKKFMFAPMWSVALTYMHGKWLCDVCQDREKKGLPLQSSESVKENN